MATGILVTQIDELIRIEDIGTIRFIGDTTICIEEYKKANGYNQYEIGYKIIVNFVSHLITKIHFNK